MEFRVIDEGHKQDINLKNDSFEIVGKLIPTYQNETWSYEIKMLPKEEQTSMCFPDENYQYEDMKEDHVFVGAYENEECVGLAILSDAWFRYMCLDDLKVSAVFRGKGVGEGLIQKSLEVAKNRNYMGIYAICQDNNVKAAKFYLKNGFEIGGFDNRSYRGTNQENKADIYFYL